MSYLLTWNSRIHSPSLIVTLYSMGPNIDMHMESVNEGNKAVLLSLYGLFMGVNRHGAQPF